MDHRLEWAGEQKSMSTGFSTSMENRLGRRLGPEFDDFPTWMDDRLSGPNSMTTGFVCQWIMDSGWAGEPNSMTTRFRVGWRIALTRTRIRRRLDSDASHGGLAVGRPTEFGVDWISMEDRLGRRLGPEFDDYCFSTDWAAARLTRIRIRFEWIIASRLRLGRQTGVTSIHSRGR